MNNKLYETPSLFSSVSEVNNSLKKVIKITENNDELLENLSDEELNSILFNTEKIAISTRNAMENSVINTNENNEIFIDFDAKTNPVSVDFNGKILKISCPFTFKRFYRKGNMQENYLFRSYIVSALKSWQISSKTNLKNMIEMPLTVLIIRKGKSFNRSKICDNDNLENGRIINEIVDTLGYSDNVLQMDLYSCFRFSNEYKDYGMEFIVCSTKDFIDVYSEYLLGQN